MHVYNGYNDLSPLRLCLRYLWGLLILKFRKPYEVVTASPCLGDNVDIFFSRESWYNFVRLVNVKVTALYLSFLRVIPICHAKATPV